MRRAPSSGDGAHEPGTVSAGVCQATAAGSSLGNSGICQTPIKSSPGAANRDEGLHPLGPGSVRHIPPSPHPEPVKLRAAGQQPPGRAWRSICKKAGEERAQAQSRTGVRTGVRTGPGLVQSCRRPRFVLLPWGTAGTHAAALVCALFPVVASAESPICQGTWRVGARWCCARGSPRPGHRDQQHRPSSGRQQDGGAGGEERGSTVPGREEECLPSTGVQEC